MKIRQRATIRADPAELWPWFADSERQQLWNPKLESHTAPDVEPLGEGDEYWTTYRMREGSTATRVRARLVRYRPLADLESHYEGGDLGRDGWARAYVALEPRGSDHTGVRRTLEIHDPRLPMWVRVMGSLPMRFGEPMGEADLDVVARLVSEARSSA